MALSVRSENECEDLLGLWSDLESGLGVVLTSPYSAQEFSSRVLQYDKWMQNLMQSDADVGLYFLFQLACNSPVGYSASHALVCAVLCHMLAKELSISAKERDSLVRAALTMNLAMTALQDDLAKQVEKPSAEQQEAIRAHSMKGAMMLANLGVADNDWIDIVSSHHDDTQDHLELQELPSSVRLARVLKVVDRYAAMISPRISRAARSTTESARSVMAKLSAKADTIGHALVRCVGLYPPGTYVRMDNEALGVVVRHSDTPNRPFVAVLTDGHGEPLPAPLLYNTAKRTPRVRSALEASITHSQVNHFQILRLGTYAAHNE